MAVQARPEMMTPEELAKFGRSGVEELTRIADHVFKAEQQREAHPEDPEAALELETAELEQRLFFVEHDNAGAFKTKKLGRRFQELFQPGPDGKTAIGFDEKGDLQMDASLGERRFLLVNMGELDRFNKEGGGHAAGDAALAATAQAIERIVNEALVGKEDEQAEYSVYRFDGNTFAVDLASMPLSEFGKLAVRLQEAQPRVEGVKDPAPLTVRGLDFRDVVGMVNHLQAELPAGAKLDTPEEASREIFGMLRRMADWDLEAAKFEARAARMQGKIGEDDAEAFFDNYIKKSFQDTELGSFEGFRQALESGNFQESVDALAIRHAEKRFADGRKVDDRIQEMIDARVRERGVPLKLKPEDAENNPPSRQLTTGKRILDDRAEAAQRAEAAAAERPEDRLAALQARKSRLEYQIEAAQRDGNTGLLDRGTHYEELEKAIEENRDVATVFVDMGFLKYFDQMGGAEVGDEALKTAARMMEQAIRMAGVEGTAYRYGGDEFTIQVEGGASAAAKVMRAFEDLRILSEPIGRTRKSRKEYEPTKLSFNYGLSDRVMLDELYRVAKDGGALEDGEQADAARARNLKAELMTKAADVGIEYNKAYSRFMLLIEALRDPDYAADSTRKLQTDSLIGFSNKAIFAELGGADHLRVLAADLALEGEALEEAVLDYVVDKVAETRARERGQKDVMDLLLSAQTKVSFLTGRLREMENRTNAQSRKLQELKTRLDKAEEEKTQLIQARSLIDRGA